MRMSASSVDTDTQATSPLRPAPNGVFRQLAGIRRVRRRLINELFFSWARPNPGRPAVALPGAASLRKLTIYSDIVMLIVFAVASVAILWFGERSRASMEGCSTNPVAMEFLPELNVAMT